MVNGNKTPTVKVLSLPHVRDAEFLSEGLWGYSPLWGMCGAGAPSTGAELGTDKSWPACMRSLTRSWHPSCSIRTAILAMLRESSRPQ